MIHEVLRSIRDQFRTIKSDLLGMDGTDLVMRLTLIDLLFRPVGDWLVRPFILILAALGLINEKVLRSPWTWLTLTLLTAFRVLRDWPMSDNHAYLLCYWCLALFITRLLDNDKTIAINGKLLIGLVFAFSTLWKVGLSDDYRDGRFFRVSMYTDPRFANAIMLAGGIDEWTVDRNQRYLMGTVDANGAAIPKLIEPKRARLTASFLTWWTIFIEATIAASFLWPFHNWFRRNRDLFLLLFCVTTYAVAAVAGFAWLLIIMGLAQCEVSRAKVRSLYLGAFCLVLFYKFLPWDAIVSNLK